VRIVFWGTPEFARTVLLGLLNAGHDVVGAVTQPDRPAGRGRKLKAPPVKTLAEEYGLPVLQPDRPRGDEFMTSLRALGPDISTVAAYGHILRPEVLDLPPLKSINVHASLLPELRGAAPVNWAIIRGYRESGVTIMRMVQAMDAGPVIVKRRSELAPDITAGELTRQLAELGADALLEALEMIAAGRGGGEPQDEEAATYAPKLSADDARLDWTLPAVELERWIRGTDPVPGAWTDLEGVRVRMFAPRVVASTPSDADPGRVVTADPRVGLRVATGAGMLEIGEVQPAGKRRMEAANWIRGRGIEPGRRFA
jgi:methionyl-tRNA formyltransferase